MEQQLNSNPPQPSNPPQALPSSVADPQASSVPPIVEERIVKPTGETSVRRYIKGKFLGKGGFAKCYEFTSQETGQINAAKVILKASLTKSRAK
jgi:polo-like kinase 1